MTREDLLDAGWSNGDHLESLLEEAARLEVKGNKLSYILKRLNRLHPRHTPTLSMRDQSLPFAEAIDAEGKEAERNLRIARRSMRELMASPVIEAGALMPDACPAGSGVATIPVGGAIAVKNAIVPAAHSADICCSLYATIFERHEQLEIAQLMDALVAATRFGPGGRSKDDWVDHPVIEEDVWDNPFLKGLQKHARMHMADQGDGNHFAYLGSLNTSETMLDQLTQAGHESVSSQLRPNHGYQVLITHHGSRGLGAQVFQRGQKAAVQATKAVATGVPENAAWLSYESDEGKAYWEALQYVSRWTLANHQSIHRRFMERTESVATVAFGNEHNFVWKRENLFMHGKGATPAWNDEDGRPLLGWIPLNMANPILLVLGGNKEDYLSFGPHGAGRNESRRALQRRFRLKDGSLDEDAMRKELANGIGDLDVRWYRGHADISESPIGYKSPEEVRAQIEKYGLATVVAEVQPLGCVMAGHGARREEELTPKQLRQQEHRADRRNLKQVGLGDWGDGE